MHLGSSAEFAEAQRDCGHDANQCEVATSLTGTSGFRDVGELQFARRIDDEILAHMERVFPLGFPASTAWYLMLLVVTFALHQAFVHYVVAGSLYVTWATIFPGRQEQPRAAQPLAATLRDWLPFGLGAAITAGVAPLLFVQIVYPREFYTANLLLAWRWLMVIPVLGVAFYLLYLLKSEELSRWRPAAQRAVAAITTGCLLFVGFCWTSNHLLSIREASWVSVYAGGPLPQSAEEVVSRMLVWLGGAAMTMSVIAGWQLMLRQSSGEERLAGAVETRRLALLSLCGAGVAAAGGLVYASQSTELAGTLRSPLALPYLIVAVLGMGLQASAWLWQLRTAQLARTPLAVAALGAALALLGASVVREALRLASVNLESLYSHHAKAAQIGGLTVFLLFAVINVGLIGICIWLVRRGLRRAASASRAKKPADEPQASERPRSVTV